MDYAREAEKLAPYLLKYIRQSQQPSAAPSSSGMIQHDIGGSWHTGTLDNDQAPQFLLADGSRPLTGNLSVNANVLIDGVDISAHAANPSAHHAPVTAGTLISLSGQQVSVAAGAAYQFIGTGSDTTPEWRNVSELAGNGLTATSGVLAVGVSGLGLSVSADAVTLTSSSNPGAAASILASDASGYLTLVRLSTSDRLRSPILDTAAGNLTIQPAADIVLNPAGGEVRLAANRALQSDNYASQTTGMRLTYAGEGDFRYLFADELHAKSFIADLEQALAGGQIISKSVAVLASAFTAPPAAGAATLVVRDLPSAPDMACFVSGDIVRLRQFSRAAGSLSIADCWGVVTGYVDNADGTQSWTFTRSSAPNAGAMAAGTVIQPEAIVLDYGTTGNGFYEVNAIDGAYGLNSPYAQIVSWATHPATGQTVRSRLGNLSGLFGVADEYGLYAGNGAGVNDAHLRMSNVTSLLQNIPLDFYESGTRYLTHSAASGVQILSGPLSGEDGYLRNNRAVTWHTALPGNASNIIGGVGVGTDGSTRNATGLTSISYDGRTAQLDLTAGRDGVSLAFLLMEASGTSSATKINVRADRIYLNGLLYATDGTIGTPATNPIWHGGNDGSGSGLDADLLDGNHASAFGALASVNTWTQNNYFNANVGIGTTAPGDMLEIRSGDLGLNFNANYQGSSYIYAYNRTTYAYSPLSFIASSYSFGNGNVGIGTASPAALCDVNGRILAVTVGYDWSELTPQNGWSNYGAPNATFGIKRFGDQISVKGLVRATTTIASNTAINAQLAAVYRPAAGRSFACMASIGGAKAVVRVYVDSSGYIRPQDGFNSNDWLSVEFTYFTGG